MTTRSAWRLDVVVDYVLAAGPARAAPRAGTAGALSLAVRAGAPEDTGVAAETPPAPVAKVIPQEQVFRAADELGPTLRSVDAASENDQAVSEVESLLATAQADRNLWADLDPRKIETASSREVERLGQALAREDQALAGGQAVLESRLGLMTNVAQEVQRHLESWEATLEAARQENAPATVLRQIADTTDGLRAAERRLKVQRGRLLELEGRVSALRGELKRASLAVAQAETTLTRQLLEFESAPLWRAIPSAWRAGVMKGQFRQAYRESSRDIATFLAESRGRIGIHLAVAVALGLGLLGLRRPVQAMEQADPALVAAVRVLDRPWAAAFLLSLPLMAWAYPPLPPAVKDLVFVAILVPLVRLLPGLVSEVFRRPLYALSLLFAFDKLASFAPPRTLLARLALLLVTVVALVGLLRGMRRGAWVRALRSGGWGTTTRATVVAAIVVLAVSAASNLIGNVDLAARLTHATLASATLAALLLGMQTVLETTLAAVLHLPFVQRRKLVGQHRRLIQQRVASVLRLAGVALWAWRTAVAFGVEAAILAAAESLLAFRIRMGGLDVALGNVAAFLVTLALALAVSRAIRFVLDEGVFPEFDLPRGVSASLSKTAQYVVLVIGFSWAMLASGIEASRFSFLVGALGVGVGFGLQNVVNNFVSGLILLFERPVQIGDVVEVSGVSGEVARIGVRSSTVRTPAGAEVIVPNANLISSAVTNWTRSGMPRRVELTLGVAYGEPPQQVIELLLAAVHGRAGVLESPAPAAIITRIGDTSVQFSLSFSTVDFRGWKKLASDVMADVLAGLDRAGIKLSPVAAPAVN